MRVVNKGAVAFVSSGNILRQAGKEISKSVGKFIAGWWTIFALLGKPISRYTTSQATAKATSLSSASQIHDTITASNMATDVQGVAAAAEGLISKHLPQSVQYYSKVYEKYLIKDIDKNIGIKNLTIKVKL